VHLDELGVRQRGERAPQQRQRHRRGAVGDALEPRERPDRLFAGGEDGGAVEVAWGSHAFDIVHVDDVAEAIRALACKPDGLAPVYHVNGGPITIREIRQTVLRRRPGTQIVIRDQEPAVVYPLVSSKRIEIETGFRPRFGARATIEDCIVNANTPKRREACLR
ncbi:MAG: NAD(P)-dependent oxidoreductase, partial [Caldilineaceae bacterium]|nr:NAD(P)-dependent oxidoreductase [Caldilineaceae bacterium]